MNEDKYLIVRVGDDGEVISFRDLNEVIDYLNERNIGRISSWVQAGCHTEEFWGDDYVVLHWIVGHEFLALNTDERAFVEMYVL